LIFHILTWIDTVSTTISQELHRIRKAPLLPFFSKRAVVELEPLIRAKVDQICAGMKNFMEQGEPLILGRAFTALTLDVITDYCFRNSWNCLDDPEFSLIGSRL
jgi:cytochrome P450